MIRIQLPEAEAQGLEQLFRATNDRPLRDRLQIVLMAQRGRPRQDIAADLGIHRRTVSRWLNAYCAGGLDGLRPRRPKGATAHIPDTQSQDLRRWVIDAPAPQGRDPAGCTHAELADHLLKTHGLRTSRSAVQRFCAKIGIRVYRPTYRYLRGDPDKQAQAKQDIAALKKKRRRVRSSC